MVQVPWNRHPAAARSRGLSGTTQAVLFGLAATVPRKVQCRRRATGVGGKFYQLDGAAAAKDLVPAAFGPLGVVVAGWTEDELETLVAPLLEDSFAGGDGSAAMVPVRVLDKVPDPPVAEGVVPAHPPVPGDLLPGGDLPRGTGAREPERSEKKPEAATQSRSRRRRSPSKKKKEKKPKKEEEDKKKAHRRSRERSEKPASSSARARPKAAKVEESDKEEDEPEAPEREPSENSPDKRETRTRRPTRSEEAKEASPPAEEPDYSGGDEEESEDADRSEPDEGPPGECVLRPRPQYRPAGQLRPPEPPGPPPHWRGPIPAGRGARPAAREEVVEVGGVLERYRAGEKVVGCQVPAGGYRRGDWLLIEEGTYYKQTIQAAGRVLKEEIDSEERELHLELTGTKSEDLLKFATGQGQGLCRLHLCRDNCEQVRENPDLVHTRHVKKLPDVGEKTWENNLLQERETDLLRADHERWKKEEDEKRKRRRSSSSSKDKKAKKKKKKKKKEEKEVVGEKDSPERRKARLGSKTHAQKTLEACFSNTGLDPNQKVRLRIARRAKKALRKSRESSSSTSSGSSSKASSGDEVSLLEDRSKIHRLADRAPGVLTASSISNMAKYLTQVTATGWETSSTKVPPLLSLYSRVYVANRLSGGMLREFMTLSHSADLLLQAKISECLDIMVQRLKSLEARGSDSPPGESPRPASQRGPSIQLGEGQGQNQGQGVGERKRQGEEQGQGRGVQEASLSMRAASQDYELLGEGVAEIDEGDGISGRDYELLGEGGSEREKKFRNLDDHGKPHGNEDELQEDGAASKKQKLADGDGRGRGHPRGSGDCLKASEYQTLILKGLMEDCARVEHWCMSGMAPTWEEFFKVKGVDYKGDEVLTAQTMRLENVRSALPAEVGGVPLEDVVEKGCRHYVLNFEDYLLAVEDQVPVRPPRVLVPPEAWEEFCCNLLQRGIFARVHEDDVYRVQDTLLLNGLFGVSKQEYDGQWESLRIIMNMVPVNSVCRGIEGDVSTLPSWAGMSPLSLEEGEEMVVSSEDVRCFFYIFKVPCQWHRFLAFNRPLPPSLVGDKPGRWYPCSAVLPMGFKNSVSLAQHVHRVIAQHALQSVGEQGGEAELRKDRPFPRSNPVHRIYLDNFDQLTKVSSEAAKTLQGTVSSLVQGLREEYASLGVPRHPKKAVQNQPLAEVQGAMVDGRLGVAVPKVEKVLKYAHLSRLLLEEGKATQKQMQIVGGGLVYMAMFRRPLLGGLNHIWQFILHCEGYPPCIKFALPEPVRVELIRFLGMIPLVYMDFRNEISPFVTASDASTTGGGVTVSSGLTPEGAIARQCSLRGDIVEPADVPAVLTIGLFDGIGALRVAADALGWNVAGHISVEKSKPAQRVVESRFPNCILVEDVQAVDAAMVKDWARRFSQVALVLIGGGPPCQGVSGLNAARKGALRDARSCLFSHVARIRELVRQAFPWAQVRSLMENVASMDKTDQDVMTESFGEEPWHIDAEGVSLAHRPRLYWLDWELQASPEAVMGMTPPGRRSVKFHSVLEGEQFLSPGWRQVGQVKLPTFTTSRPRDNPRYKPAGLHQCTEEEKNRWIEDQHRFPPYQYQEKFLLCSRAGEKRLPNVQEREVIMGFPRDYTANCLPKKDQGSVKCTDLRLTLVGNSWNVTVISWLLSQLGSVLGFNPAFSVGEVVKRTSPGCQTNLQTFLSRPSMKTSRRGGSVQGQLELVKKLLTLVSMKGEDILIQSASEDQVKYHRLRASIPAKLWRWKTVAGWRWTGMPEHINNLEMRAVLTALRWRLERHKAVRSKFADMDQTLQEVLDSLPEMDSVLPPAGDEAPVIWDTVTLA
eukprot:s757_g20.t1